MSQQNLFLFADWVTTESLRQLLNNLTVASMFNTDYNKEFTREFAIGESVRVKLPQRFTVRDGLAYTPQPVNRQYTTVNCNQIFGVDFEWDSVESALKAERGRELFDREYIAPAMSQIAQEIDSRAAQWAYLNTNNIVGVLGTNPTALSTYNQARQKLVENGCPPGKKAMIISPGMNVSIGSAVSTLFNPTAVIADAFKSGVLGQGAGFDWYESMSLYSHTAGTWAGAVTTAAAVDGATSLSITGTSGDTFKAGDVISIGSVNNVNPKTRRTTGSAKLFVVTQDLTATAGPDTLYISPAIYGPGSQYQNVDALPAASAALTLWPGTSSPSAKSGINGLALHGDAFALVGVPLEVPKAVEIGAQKRDPETGIAVRFVRMFDPVQSKMVNRFDVLLGFGNLYADNCAVRVASST